MIDDLNFNDYKRNVWTIHTAVSKDRRYVVSVKCNGFIIGKSLRFPGRIQYEEYLKKMLNNKRKKKNAK